MCNQLGSRNNVREYRVSSRTYQAGREAFMQTVVGRPCTWGDLISKSKKGVSQGKRSPESVLKQKQTVAANPYKHSKEIIEYISAVKKGVPKTIEHKKAISNRNKERGIKPPSQSKPVLIEGVKYGSIAEACIVLKIPRHQLKRCYNLKYIKEEEGKV